MNRATLDFSHLLSVLWRALTDSPVKILFFALILALCLQGTRGLFDEDETRYAECAREMLISGQFLVPQRDFRPHITKPPLTYWAIAASMKVFGINEWAARLPNAVAFGVTTFLLVLLASKLWDQDTGRLAGLIYMTSLVPFAASNIITTDTLLGMWEVCAVWAFVNCYKAATRRQARIWSYLMGLFWGMAFLTKGPAILPVGAAILIFWWFHRRLFKLFPFGPVMLGLFVLTGGLWYLLLILNDFSRLQFFITEQVTGRLIGNVHHRNSGLLASLYIYLPTLLLGAMPWLGILLKKAKTTLVSKAIFQDEGLFLAYFWFLIPLGVFSLASSKLPLYILPVFSALSLLTARHLTKANIHTGSFTKWLLTWCCLLVVLKGTAAYLPFQQDARRLVQHIPVLSQPDMQIWSLTETFIDGIPFYTGKDILYLQWHTENKIAEANLEDRLNQNKFSGLQVILLVPNAMEQACKELLLAHNVRIQEMGGYKKSKILQLSFN